MSLQENWFSLSNTKNSHRHVTVCNKHYNRLCHTKRGSPSNMRASGHKTLLLLLSFTKLLRLFWMWTIHSTSLNNLDIGVKTFLHIKVRSRDQCLLRTVVRRVSFTESSTYVHLFYCSGVSREGANFSECHAVFWKIYRIIRWRPRKVGAISNGGSLIRPVLLQFPWI